MATTTAAGEDVRARLAKRAPKVVSEDALQRIRNKIAEIRELDGHIADLTAQLGEKQAARTAITDTELPDLMRQYTVTSITLAAAGNLPAYDATLETVYYAGLPKKATPEQREAGFKFLVEVWKVPDIIKNAVTLTFGAGESKRAKKLFGLLKKNKFEYGNEVSVHSGTLTAELRRRVRAGELISPSDLAKIGGYVKEVVNTEPVKKDK
jgi:hypothetical protein